MTARGTEEERATERGFALAPFAVALSLAVVVRLALPFDGLYGQDAFAYFRFARAIWPHLRSGAPLPLLYWPMGYPVVVALLLPLTHGLPAAGQIVSSLSCAVAATATFVLVRKLRWQRLQPSWNRQAALVAGLSVALSGGVLRTSQVVMADGLACGAAATALACAVGYMRSGKGRQLVACALAVAVGAVTRWLIGLLVIPLALYFAIEFSRRATHAGGTRASLRTSWPWFLLAATVALGVLIPQLVVAHSVPNSLENHDWLVFWNLGNAFKREFHTPEGRYAYRLPVGLFNAVRLGWPDYFFPTMGVFAAFGAWIVVRERCWAAAGLLLGWPLVVWLFLSGIPYVNPRFLLPTLPCIAALVGIGFGSLVNSVAQTGRRALWIAIVASLAAGIGAGVREHARRVTQKRADLDLVAWASDRVPSSATLLMMGTLTFEYYGGLHVRELFDLPARDLDELLSGGIPLYLMVDLADLDGQWAGLGPDRYVRRLRGDPGLVQVAAYGPTTLFRVGR
jgi:4-amino-4-deoxy-L-arabinose transferase-like glycosyltransferase